MSVEEIPGLVRQLYNVVERLESVFEGRKFTPDGHLVGSLGEVLVAHAYGLSLLPNSCRTHDAETRDGLKVQVKATQRSSIAMSSEPDHLIVIKLSPEGSFLEVFNGPGRGPWTKCGPVQKNGQRRITLATLKKLMDSVTQHQRLPRVRQ